MAGGISKQQTAPVTDRLRQKERKRRDKANMVRSRVKADMRKETAFAQFYALHPEWSEMECARMAGFGEMAKSEVLELLDLPHVNAEVTRLQDLNRSLHMRSVQQLIPELLRVATSSVSDYLEIYGGEVSLRDLDPDDLKWRAVESVQLSSSGGVRLKLYNKLAAIEQLCKLFGLIQEKGTEVNISVQTAVQAALNTLQTDGPAPIMAALADRRRDDGG